MEPSIPTNHDLGSRLLLSIRTSRKNKDTKKPLTQRDVELTANNLGFGNLAKYESGKIQRPKIETIADILNAIDQLSTDPIRFNVKREVFEAYGYKMPAYKPTETEISLALADSKKHIDTHPYPAYLLDNTLTIVYLNDHFRELSGVKDIPSKERLLLSMPLFHALYHPELRLIDRMVNPDVFMPAAMSILLYELERSGKAGWFQRLIADASERYHEFRRHWGFAIRGMATKPQSMTPLVARKPNNSQVEYYVAFAPYSRDDRFRLIHYLKNS